MEAFVVRRSDDRAEGELEPYGNKPLLALEM